MVSSSMSLTEFYREHYVPQVMEDPSPRAREGYEYALARWRECTGDPPLAAISSALLADFKQFLGRCVIRGGGVMSQNTRRKYLDHIQWILDQAGPPMAIRRLRNAAGILERVPWTKPPGRERRKKPPMSESTVIAIYQVADRARFPRTAGIRAGAWWRALISTICSTSLRYGQLAVMPMSCVVWAPAQPLLRLPAEVCRKSKSDESHPLHPIAFRDLLAIRGDRELLFGHPHSKTTIYAEFHRLEQLAGCETTHGVAFHGIRRRVLTELGKISPTAAQLAAGHQAYSTTIEHYIGGEVLEAAVRQLDLFSKLG